MDLNETRQIMNEESRRGSMLAESAQWKPFVEDIRDDFMKIKTAVVLENTKKWLESMEESTRAISVGDFQKYAFPLVRAIFPELVTHQLVSSQPMMSPSSLVFYLDFVYGSNKGKVQKGQKVFDSIGIGPNNPNYSSAQIDEEAVATGNGSTAAYTLTLSYSPVRAGSVTITDGAQIVTDDGNGGLAGDCAAGGTINYTTGEVSVTFLANVANGVAVTATYEYDLEGQSNIPEIDLMLTSSPVVARPRKLKAKWSLEAAFNLRALHGLEAEAELTSAVGGEMRFEIDREVLGDLVRIVPSQNYAPVWSKSKMFKDSDGFTGASGAAATVGLTEQYLSLVNQFVCGSNKIFASTGRAVGQWIVIGMTVADVVETLPGFIATPGIPNGMTKGVYMSGTLNSRWTIFKDPFFANASEWLMGYRGTTMLEAGYIYAPYIPFYTTPLIVLDDFMGRKGMATQYAKKVVNRLFYAKGRIEA